MNKNQLIEKLNQLSGNPQIFIYEPDAEFKYQPLEFITKKKVGFSEEPDGKVLAKDTVIVLSDSYNPKP